MRGIRPHAMLRRNSYVILLIHPISHKLTYQRRLDTPNSVMHVPGASLRNIAGTYRTSLPSQVASPFIHSSFQVREYIHPQLFSIDNHEC